MGTDNRSLVRTRRLAHKLLGYDRLRWIFRWMLDMYLGSMPATLAAAICYIRDIQREHNECVREAIHNGKTIVAPPDATGSHHMEVPTFPPFVLYGWHIRVTPWPLDMRRMIITASHPSPAILETLLRMLLDEHVYLEGDTIDLTSNGFSCMVGAAGPGTVEFYEQSLAHQPNRAA